jgi:hypothetical protein
MTIHRAKHPSNFEHDVVYFKRIRDSSVPAREFLRDCPASVRAKFSAVLVTVASAPPKKFSGGGYWEAMHGEMIGWYEVRVSGPNRRQFRLFCFLDYQAIGEENPLLSVITGMDKAFQTVFKASEYQKVCLLGLEYWSVNPRSLVRL